MCFTGDYDWAPEVVEEECESSGERTRCDECRLQIHPEEWRQTIHMAEYEYCRDCGEHIEDDCECDGEVDEVDHGHTYDYVCCERCHKLIEAISAVERAEGCSRHESRPPLGNLYEDVGVLEWSHYADEARKLGLHEAAGLMPSPPVDLVFRDLSKWGYWSAYPGEFPQCWPPRHSDQEYDIGGEG